MDDVKEFLGEDCEIIYEGKYKDYDCYFIPPISPVMQLGLPIFVLKKDKEIRFVTTPEERHEIMKLFWN